MERHNYEMKELKITGQEEMTFSGYGAIFGVVDWYGDSIRPGAFTDTLSEAKSTGQWPSMLLQHGMTSDADMPIGIWTMMEEDSLGLRVEGKLAQTERGKEVYALMKMEPRPAINGLSIGFIPQASEPRVKPEDPKRTLTKIALMEVSLVTFPANLGARVHSVKSGLTERVAEQALRDAGFSRSESKKIVAEGFKSIPQRDVDDLDIDKLAEIVRRNIETIRKGN